MSKLGRRDEAAVDLAVDLRKSPRYANGERNMRKWRDGDDRYGRGRGWDLSK